MDIGRLRQRIIFLRPRDADKNGMDETITGWFPFHPVSLNEGKQLYITQNNEIVFSDGVLRSITTILNDYAVWADVSPMTGKEYAESQKIREETTYKVKTRFFSGISANMKILYGTKIFDIVSVLNVGELKRELQIVCSEVDSNGKS